MRLINIFIAAMMLMLTACHSATDEADARLSDAETALNRGDVVTARSLADAVAEDSGSLRVSSLGRLSILYMKLNDTAADDTDDVTKAVRFYRAAFDLNADSAVAFYTDLSPEDITYIMTLSTIVGNIDNPLPFPDETADSLFTDSIFHHEH